jgi:predicted DsbA family dithiol-disulfide isomerase
VDRLKQRYELATRWIAFPLHPETPPEGRSLEDLFAGRVDLPAMLAGLEQVARQEGLAWGIRRMTYNSRLAQELAKYAEAEGRGEEFHRAVFEAYFAEGLNIGRPQVVLELAVAAGLDPNQAGQALAEGRYAPQVDQDWRYARQRGVQAVPSFLAGGRMIVGAQPYETLEALVKAAGAQGRH